MDDRDKQISKKAAELIRLSSDTIIVSMRFMDVALGRLKPEEKAGLFGTATDGEHFFYDSGFVLRRYLDDVNAVTRMLLHSLLHCVFNHSFNYDKTEEEVWDLACDIAVENIIMELEVPSFMLHDDSDRKQLLRGISMEVRTLTAEKIYKYFLVNPLSKSDRLKFEGLFVQDRHIYWRKLENYEISEQAWKKISERIKTDLGTFSKASGHSESLIKNLVDTTKKKYDYKRLLEQFTVMGEELKVNDEEFDYIYYTYGLEHYGNMPLIEPLEYREDHRIRDFVIAIDTSGSVAGEEVQTFLRRTYGILNQQGSFFRDINVHIIQCDAEIQDDTVITCTEDFDRYLETMEIRGLGGTDFRPVFTYVDRLIKEGAFSDLKGLIYFTDGLGTYPEAKPPYRTAFVFVDDGYHLPAVPVWAIRVLLQQDELHEGI